MRAVTSEPGGKWTVGEVCRVLQRRRQYPLFRIALRGGPGGIVVKFMRSTSAAQGLLVQILGANLYTAYQAMLWQCPTYKMEEDVRPGSSPAKKRRIGGRYWLRANIPQKKNY